ncbi:replication protein [Pseudomonas fulva]|uniref:replication protein n=1 Tax=Pseudomonas fulva TaxID=47880 RepID=UPI00191F0A43|nr:replication protein [Pseudomonas fulva]MBN4165066.1 replication protein [Pseudomonas fulva]
MTNITTLRNTGGFTRMDNDLMEALATVDLPARELRVVMAIARQTIGYQVEAKRLSADDLGKHTNMRRDVTSKAISHLLERRIIFRVGGSRGDIGISPINEWVFYEEKKHSLSETKSSHSAQIVSLVPKSSETKTATSHLYTKKEPLVTVPTEQITAPQGAEPAQLEADQVSFNGEDFHVSTDLITKWAAAYAPIDVEAEIKRAAAWASGSKPKKNWRRFLVNWLGRAFKRSPNGASEAGVPVDKIIDLYHRVCPNLPAVTVKSDKVLRSMIAERWNESPDHQSGQSFWLGFFQKANNRNQVFFRGQNVQPRLEALVSRAVFREISEAAQ